MRVLADSTEPLSSSAASNRAAPFGLSAPLVRIRPNGIQLAVSGRSLLRRPDLRAIRHAGGHSVVFVLGDADRFGKGEERSLVLQPPPQPRRAAGVEITGDGHPRNNDEVLFRLVQLRLELFRTGLEVFEAVSDELARPNNLDRRAEQQRVSGESEVLHRRVQRPSEDRTVDRPEEVIQRWHALRHPRVHQFSLLALWWQLLGLECQRVNRRQECREPGIEIGSRLSLSSAPCVSALEPGPKRHAGQSARAGNRRGPNRGAHWSQSVQRVGRFSERSPPFLVIRSTRALSRALVIAARLSRSAERLGRREPRRMNRGRAGPYSGQRS